MTVAPWSGRKVTEARTFIASRLPAACGQCGKTVTTSDRWVVGHIKSRITHPELTWEPSNWRAEHRACSDASGQAAVIEKAKRDALRDAGVSVFPHPTDAAQPPPLPVHTLGSNGEPWEVREALSWASFASEAPEWLSGYLDVPEDAAAPLAMTPVHPRAVGSYGAEAIEWVERELPDVKRLRWWQRLAFVRQYEHDADGALVWRLVLESGPRRIGKSVRLRGQALWRLDVGAELFEEPQLVIHTGKDREIVKEIHKKAYAWAQARDGWDVRRGAGMEEVSSASGLHRWLVRSTDGVYGYDTTNGMVDEAWAVDPATFDDGLEPSTMERISPQLLLTSTAHRKATSLMRARVASALAQDDDETLLLLWGARPQDDPADPAVWRSASPHWSDDRHRMIAAKFAKAQAGEVDPQADDLNPMAGFVAQYLNVWNLRQPKGPQHGDPITDEATWAETVDVPPLAVPDAAALESWTDLGVSLALAWRLAGDRVVVSVVDYPDLPAAVTALEESGFRGATTVGASLADDPALKRTRKRPGKGRVADSVAELGRLLAEDALRHDGGEHLAGQVLEARTVPSADGRRMASRGRADAIKAAVWAAGRARLTQSVKPRFITAQNSE